MKNNKIVEKSTNPYSCKIYIAGDLAVLTQECREYCMEVGLCVTVTPTNYVYTGGEETGAIIELINYARFPKTEEEIDKQAVALGYRLMHQACQGSFSVVDSLTSTFYSRRNEDLK